MKEVYLYMNTRAIWKNPSTKIFYLYRSDTDEDPLVLSEGSCITWEGRNDYVKIVRILGTASEEGPRGFTYLPYREEGRWATPLFSLRGDPRFIICYPSGIHTYGLHIQLHTIQVDDVPVFTDTPGIITLSGNPFFKETIIEIRHKLLRMFSNVGLTSQLKKNVYLCWNDEVKFRVKITRAVETSNFRVDVYHISGNVVMLHHYIDQLDLYVPSESDTKDN